MNMLNKIQPTRKNGLQGTQFATRWEGFKKTKVYKFRQYYLLLPAFIDVLIFCYGPMYGLQIAFKDYKMSLGIFASKWIGFRNFTDFFGSYPDALNSTKPCVSFARIHEKPPVPNSFLRKAMLSA